MSNHNTNKQTCGKRCYDCRLECADYDWSVGTCHGVCYVDDIGEGECDPPDPFDDDQIDDEQKKPEFDADAAEDFITNLCIEVRKAKEEVFRKDNSERDRFDFVYSDQYYKLLGQEIAYRKVLEYFTKFDF